MWSETSAGERCHDKGNGEPGLQGGAAMREWV